ncbi:gEgh 16 [Fusarium circinatum]|uniref:GEgh 16 n=1 Tax=Fusarium circinatum TaxID=48490 RepID=A0A8H5SQG7_FUSCI|nr:gEgh 16 [Fusarium circinatum]
MLTTLFLSALAWSQITNAHGTITRVIGANGVVMPGLTILDGTPRSSTSAASGAQVDTSVIRDPELGTSKASALGRTSKGPVDGARVIKAFMKGLKGRSLADTILGGGEEATREAVSFVTGNAGAVVNGVQDGIESSPVGGLALGAENGVNGLLGDFFQTAKGVPSPRGYIEDGIQNSTGVGAKSGLPTTASDGTLKLIYHQVNEDGAGPLLVDIDFTSGGTDPKAFKSAEVVQNIIGVLGFSTVSSTDFPVVVKVPTGQVCTGKVAGVSGVCIARVRNSATAGPFGGAGAFTHNPEAAKGKKSSAKFRHRHV